MSADRLDGTTAITEHDGRGRTNDVQTFCLRH